MKQLYIFLLYFVALVWICGKVEAQATIGIDPSFNIGTGVTGLNSSVHSIALQTDGKILAGGDFTTFNGTTQNRIVRLNSDGTLDGSFNIGTGANDYVRAIVLQPDGKILVGGSFSSFNGTAQNRIVRLNSDGTLDTSFNIGTGFNDYVISVTLQSDGKILVGGHFTTFNGTTQNRLVRLNSDGTLDTSFNTGTGFNYGVVSITLQPDGKILAGGSFATFNDTTHNKIVRLNSDGTLDTSFNIGTGFNGVYVSSIALQPDGKILVGGNFTAFNDTAQNGISRLNSDGTLDTSFSIGTGFYDSAIFSIALQPVGKILVGGSFFSFNGTTQRMIARLNSDGTLDTCFNTGLGFHDGDYASWVYSVALQPDGKILVGGLFKKYNGTTQNRITRLQELACENPPTPTVEVHHPSCFSPAQLGGAIIVESPLGSQYQYSVNGTDYQESPSFIHLPPGTYQVTVKEGCCVSDPLEVAINSLSIFPEPLEVEVVQPTCNIPYGSITITSPVTFPTGTYSINGGVNYQDGSMFENLLPGTYQVIFKNGFETCVTEIMEVTVNLVSNPPPTPEATIIPTTICNAIFTDNIGVLVITSPLGDDYEYSIDGINYQSSPDFQLWLHNFPITVTVKQVDCISDILTINNIEENSTLPIADVTQPDCSDVPESGQFGTIMVTFPLGNLLEFKYSIDGVNYQDSPVFYNVPPGSYELTFSMYDSENCVSDPLEVVINSTDIPTPEANVVQPDCDNPYGSIVVTIPFANAYEYSINGTDYQPGNVFENLSAGIYQVTVRKGDCISEVLEVNIHFAPTVPDIPTVTVVQPDCYNPYGSIIVISPVDEGHELFPNYEYSINGVDYYEHTIFDNLSSGLYYVTVRHLLSGCVSDFLEVILKGDLTCFIPKGISPNGDYKNDEFDLSGFGIIPYVQIFNRYGGEVYSQKDYTNQWKGYSNNGKELPTGTYYYVITFREGTTKTGWVYLNR